MLEPLRWWSCSPGCRQETMYAYILKSSLDLPCNGKGGFSPPFVTIRVFFFCFYFEPLNANSESTHQTEPEKVCSCTSVCARVCVCCGGVCLTRSCDLSQHGVRSSESQCYCVLTSRITTSQYYGHTCTLLVQVVSIVLSGEEGGSCLNAWELTGFPLALNDQESISVKHMHAHTLSQNIDLIKC